MGRLLRRLPLFATDYSSAASFVRDIGGLAVICCPSGCMGNYTRFDEIRWMEDPESVLQIDLREMDVIFGDRDWSEGFTELPDKDRIQMVALINTPVSTLTGFDTTAVARKVGKILGVPAVSIDTNGYGTYHDGIAKAMSAVVASLKGKYVPSGDIGILGYNSLEHSKDDLRWVSSMVKGDDSGVICYPGTGYRGLAGMMNVERNVVISSSAIGFAKRMRREYGIPFEVFRPYRCERPEGKGRILIVGEQVRSNILRDILSSEGIASDVATFFTLDGEEACEYDRSIGDEGDLVKLLEHSDYDTVIGDPMIKPLVPTGVRFIDDPQPAISSRLCWDRMTSFSGLRDRFSGI